MRRRAFLGLIGTAAAWAFAARAQDAGRVYRLGFMIPAGRESPAIAAFLDELRLNGFAEGQNVAVIWDDLDLPGDELAERATTMVKAAPDAIIAGPLPLRALQAVTRTVPIVGMTEDLVGEGLVTSLARPGGNITGISLLSPELDGKRQDILIEAVQGARRIAVLADSNLTSPRHLEKLKAAARARSVELSVFTASRPEEIVTAIHAAKASGAMAVNFLASPLFSVPGSPNSRFVIERIAELRLPAIYQWPETAEQGGMAGYGPRFTQIYRQRARMVVKVLRGIKPADIPVEQPTNFELVINLKAAKAIGHDIPTGLLLRADEVIE